MTIRPNQTQRGAQTIAKSRSCGAEFSKNIVSTYESVGSVCSVVCSIGKRDTQSGGRENIFRICIILKIHIWFVFSSLARRFFPQIRVDISPSAGLVCGALSLIISTGRSVRSCALHRRLLVDDDMMIKPINKPELWCCGCVRFVVEKF